MTAASARGGTSRSVLRLAGFVRRDPEQALLVAAVRGEAPPLVDEVDEFRLAAVASWHRVEGVLASWVATHAVGTTELREHLDEARSTTTTRWSVLDTRLDGLARAWQDAGVRPVLLKGAALVAGGVVPPGERPMADVDVLVSAAEAETAYRVAREHGFAPTRDDAATWAYATTRHHHLPALADADGTTVELHHRLLDVHHPLRRLDDVCRGRSTVTVDAVCDRLDDIGAWLHLAVHCWDDRRRGTGGALLQLRDLDLLLARIDVDELVAATRRGGAERLICTVAAVLDAVVPSVSAAMLADRLAAAPDVERVHAFVLQRVLGRRTALPQLLHPTGDVPYTPWRLLTRGRRQLWPPLDDIHRVLGPTAGRWDHLTHVAPAFGDALSSVRSTYADLRLDRWASTRTSVLSR